MTGPAPEDEEITFSRDPDYTPVVDPDVDPIAFYLVATCGHCDEDIFYGLCVSALTHRGRPAVSVGMVEQIVMHCEACGAANYTGDVEVHVEPAEPTLLEDS